MTILDVKAAELTKLLAASIASALEELRRANPTETFYGIALGLDNDWFSFELIANSEEVIARELKERAAKCGVPAEQLQSDDPYWIPSWGYTVSRLPEAENAHSDLWQTCYADGDGAFDYEIVKAKVWQCIVNALRRFAIDSETDLHKFILIPWIHDPDEPELVIDAVTALNTPDLTTKFLDDYAYSE